MWRSDCLFFPFGRDNHWFSFVVCLKEKKFAFLDSFYDANSYFHTSIRDDLVNTFVNLWDQFVTRILRKCIVFESFDMFILLFLNKTTAMIVVFSLQCTSSISLLGLPLAICFALLILII